MHYYSHNINDFNNATIHLTIEEECMYHRALAWYYSNELPLPKDKAKIYRYLRATTKKLQTAVNNILDDFFTEKEDGFHQSRCDSEIAEYQSKQAKAVEAGKASANARRKLNENKTDVEQDNHNRSTDVQQEINGRSTDVQPTKNQEPRTNNNTHTQQADDSQNDKAEQIRLERSQEIQDWQAPTLDLMRQELSKAGFMGVLTENIYQTHIKDFKAHYAEQALVGKPLNTDSLRKSKLRLWIQSAKPPKQAKPNQKLGGPNDPLAVNHKFRPQDTGVVKPNTIFEADEDGNFVARPIEQPVREAW